ncbi:MAG TPA: hypothetical protein VGK16_05440 [Candidatus Limnocylindrales bacterium]
MDDIALSLRRSAVRDRVLRGLALGRARWPGRFLAVRLVSPLTREALEVRDPLDLLDAAIQRSTGGDD